VRRDALLVETGFDTWPLNLWRQSNPLTYAELQNIIVNKLTELTLAEEG